VDAELTPALHPEEILALTRDRGLVVLPPGRALAFDPDQPIHVSWLVSGSVQRADTWQAFVEPPMLADGLFSVVHASPISDADELLGPVASPEDLPRPPRAGLGGQVSGATSAAVGSGMAWLGWLFGSSSLRDLGRRWIERGMEMSPRLSESVLGRQAAALQELLRQFRSGNIDAALKRALPMGGDPARGSMPHTTDTLPTHNLAWSLGDLFGGGQRGPATIWHGGSDLQQQLIAEYRRVAEEALRRGDHRRAAFVYGRLLGDYRSAAAALSAGGLHHEAAILYRDKLDDPLPAASEFEQAGEFDTALALYITHHEHERAGDLYRKLGDDDRALEQYLAAADRLVREREDYLGAGTLVARKTERSDLAGHYYNLGWQQRNGTATAASHAVPCAVRLARILAQHAQPEPLLQLVGEVETHLNDDRHGGSTWLFFTAAAELAELPHLEAVREELRDRSKLALAATVRRYGERESRPGSVVQDAFGRSELWSAPLMRDAAYALTARQKLPPVPEPPKPKSPYIEVRLHVGTPTAAAYASDGRVVVAGFEDGMVAWLELQTGRIQKVDARDTVVSLACDARGQVFVALSADQRLHTFWTDGVRLIGTAVQELRDEAHADAMLMPTVRGTFPDVACGLLRADGSVVFRSCLRPSMTLDSYPMLTEGAAEAGAWLPRAHDQAWLLRWAGRFIAITDVTGTTVGLTHEVELPWEPRIPPAGSPLREPPVALLHPQPDQLVIAGVGAWRHLYLSQFSLADTTPEAKSTWHAVGPEFRAAAVVRDNQVIAATSDQGLLKLRCWPCQQLQVTGEAMPLPQGAAPVACFACPVQGEVAVLLDDGRLVRVRFSV
jgi:tetratricopeptide (TPR) repeat protein